ncbi:uncharacterized protein si:dkey-260g12.1 [Triplophysa dalaica]|uniref:uncharacterized protein si:dkey-260g12.1 n=1 Tax=Triplophysa dalaica TaxID=1582913 RepID=UPI0024E00508|nr:uncharacterized protein si:dkey-260g12.1 [Triplophysa dalaica]
MLVTVLLIASGILTGHLMYGLPKQSKARYPRSCPNMCPPGQYRTHTCSCSLCRPGFFTSQENREDSCHRCFQTCNPELNMEVVEECKTTSDVKCRCQDGFTCTKHDQYTGHCKQCDPITSPTPSQVYTSRVYTSWVYTSTATTLFPRTQKPTNWMGENGVLVWIIFGFMLTMLFIIIVTVLFRICRKKEKECFKQLVRRCSLGNLEVDSESTLSTKSQQNEQQYTQAMPSHESTPTNKKTDCSFHQPTVSDQAVPPSGNLGPFHIYGPQTVFVSLLNQFEWDGGEKKASELQQEPLNNSNVPHPQSPPIHLSQEEKNQEQDFIFFPSQEQGKECHISKEEVL